MLSAARDSKRSPETGDLLVRIQLVEKGLPATAVRLDRRLRLLGRGLATRSQGAAPLGGRGRLLPGRLLGVEGLLQAGPGGIGHLAVNAGEVLLHVLVALGHPEVTGEYFFMYSSHSGTPKSPAATLADALVAAAAVVAGGLAAGLLPSLQAPRITDPPTATSDRTRFLVMSSPFGATGPPV